MRAGKFYCSPVVEAVLNLAGKPLPSRPIDASRGKDNRVRPAPPGGSQADQGTVVTGQVVEADVRVEVNAKLGQHSRGLGNGDASGPGEPAGGGRGRPDPPCE